MKKLICLSLLALLLSACNVTMDTPAQGDQVLNNLPPTPSLPTDMPDQVQNTKSIQQLDAVQHN